MSEARAALQPTDAEAAEREKMLCSLGLGHLARGKPDARIIPLDHPARRKPLGLGIVPGDDTADGRSCDYLGPQATAAKIVADSLANLPEEAWAAPATMKDLWEYGIGTALETSFADGDTFRERLRELRKETTDAQAALRSEIAELKLALTEARCEVREMRAIQESARAVSRGEQGIAGPRGVPGSQGAIGPRGEPGPRGAPAPVIAGWEPRPERFEVVPRFASGDAGPPIALLSLFQAYDAAIAECDDDEAAT